MTNQTVTEPAERPTDTERPPDTERPTDTERARVTPRPRLNLPAHSRTAYAAMADFRAAVEGLGLEESLLGLIYVRASQLNGCAYCIDMHTIDHVALGETHQRLHALSAWRETPFFTARERAVLAVTEAVTLLDGGVSDAVLDDALDELSEAEVVAVTWATGLINLLNRVAITGRATPGHHRPEEVH